MSPSILMITNMPSHHQIPVGGELYRLLGGNFRMAFMDRPDRERLAMGWKDASLELPWAIRVWESAEQEGLLRRCIDEFDCVVLGHAPVALVRKRILDGKLTFKNVERLFKRGFLPGFLWWFRRLCKEWWPLNLSNYHLLASSAYCPLDMRRIRMFKDRIWTWGYFPDVRTELPPSRENAIPKMLWAGRMLDWKRVDLSLELARRLKNRGYSFTLDLIGDGPMKEQLVRQCKRMELEDVVHFFPSASPEEVRKAMLQADVYLMTSNYQEGWGAVINEAMDSGCCVVSSKGPGAATWLIEHGRNGYLFESGDVSQLYSLVASLLDRPQTLRPVGLEAWNAIVAEWSPKVAAERLVSLTDGLLRRKAIAEYRHGPCSHTKIVS